MRHLLRLSPLAMLMACGGSDAVLRGDAPEGAARIFAEDAAGRTFDADDVAGAFVIEVGAPTAVRLVVELEDGRLGELRFDDGHGGVQSTIPAFTGAVDLGQLTVVDPSTLARTTGADDDVDVEAENNPLEDIDSDDDGDSDYEDDDDDDDGEGDEDDDDDDGDGEDDDGEDDESEDDDGTETETEDTGAETETETETEGA